MRLLVLAGAAIAFLLPVGRGRRQQRQDWGNSVLPVPFRAYVFERDCILLLKTTSLFRSGLIGFSATPCRYAGNNLTGLYD